LDTILEWGSLINLRTASLKTRWNRIVKRKEEVQDEQVVVVVDGLCFSYLIHPELLLVSTFSNDKIIHLS
jgi:hypothetical protein